MYVPCHCHRLTYHTTSLPTTEGQQTARVVCLKYCGVYLYFPCWVWVILYFKGYIAGGMKKALNNCVSLRQLNPSKEDKREDHFSYFQNLEQKLLNQSEKLTSLIAVKSLSSSDTRSVREFAQQKAKLVEPNPRQSCLSAISCEEENEQGSKASLMIQNYIQSKRKMLLSPKPQQLPPARDKDSQLQRKLTYNLVMAKNGIQPPLSKESSPAKSEAKDILKMTASTTSSSAAFLRTIDKIKRMSAKPAKESIRESARENCKESGPKGISIEDFQILKYMEEGQFGTVYLSRHKATNFLCALKKIPKKIFESEQHINQLIREIKIQSYLDHPNIVQLYSYFSDQEHLYLMLELCCGGNVYTSLRSEGRFAEEKVRGIIKQICHAIEFMHDSDIIHRDIKPQNILFHESVIKVCDFGWSIHSPLLRDTRCGTPLYSPPEVVQKQQYDNKIDIWNIGILTYELLFGRVPFEIRSQDDLGKVVDQDIYFSKGVPLSNEARDFVLSCLHKNPKDRLPMLKLVDHEFIHQSK